MIIRSILASVATLFPLPSLAEGPAVFDTVVPQSWTETRSPDAALLSSPGGKVEVRLSAIAAESAEAAARAAWADFAPGLTAEAPEAIAAPSRPGATETWFYDYDTDEGQAAQAMVERRGDLWFVALIRGDAMEAERRTAQINIVLTGFEPTGAEQADLSVADIALTSEDLETFAAFVEEALDAFDVPGASVAVVRDGDPVLVRGFGVKSRDDEEPVGPSTQFMIGSTTKTMTTMLMGQLVDEGRLDWDTPVTEVLPRFSLARPELAEAVTVSHLVCACTGVPRRDLEILFNADEMEAEDVIASLATFETFTGFGEAFQYSNQLVATGGWAAAAAAGGEWGGLNEAYFDAVASRILDPIGMTETSFRPAEVIARGDYAVPHGFGLEGQRTPIDVTEERVVRAVAPAGAAWSSAEDMAAYLATLTAGGLAPDGTRIVSEASLAKVWTPNVPVLAKVSYGLGWFVEDWNGLEVVHHGGNSMGYTSELALVPDAGIGLVVLTNGRGANEFTQALRARLFELAWDLPERESAELLVAQGLVQAELNRLAATLPADGAAVANYLGGYFHPALGEVHLTFDAGKLLIDTGESVMELRQEPQAEPGLYTVVSGLLSGDPVRFSMTGGQEAQMVFGEGVAEYVFRRAEW